MPLPERKICSSHGRPLQTEGRFKPATGRLCKDRPESSERKRIPCSDSPMEIVSGSPGQPPWKAREIFNCFSETLQRQGETSNRHEETSSDRRPCRDLSVPEIPSDQQDRTPGRHGQLSRWLLVQENIRFEGEVAQNAPQICLNKKDSQGSFPSGSKSEHFHRQTPLSGSRKGACSQQNLLSVCPK